jgi:hypothetical protein
VVDGRTLVKAGLRPPPPAAVGLDEGPAIDSFAAERSKDRSGPPTKCATRYSPSEGSEKIGSSAKKTIARIRSAIRPGDCGKAQASPALPEEQNQKERTFDVLPKPANLISYRQTREGATTTVALKDGWKLTGLVKALPDDIKAGEFVGIASTPTTAAGDHSLEVMIFSPDLNGAGKGSYAWLLGAKGAMTSATVSYAVKNADGRTLTISYHGLERRIAIAEGTPVVTFAGASRTELTAGASVFIPTERSADGILTARLVIVDAKEVVPPM